MHWLLGALKPEDWFFYVGILFLGGGIAMFDRRIAAIVVGALFIFVSLRHRGARHADQ